MALKNIMRVDNGNVIYSGGSDGTVSFDLMTKLWENPDPTQAMAADTEININDTDYDLLAYVCFFSSSNNRVVPLLLTPKNKSAYVCYADSNNSKQRRFDHSDGKVTIKAGYVGSTVDNNMIILYQIYGIKTKQTTKMDVLVTDISTSASKCMMSDGETSVEDAIEEVDNKTKRNSVTITKNTSGWTANTTWVERCGKVIVIHVFLKGTPSSNKNIVTGLPIPYANIQDYTSNAGIIVLDTSGNLYVQSPATTSSTLDERIITYIEAN